jgi:anaerobic dimethyl sulfoxide reductase subunit B (iron-sulfur subunit)
MMATQYGFYQNVDECIGCKMCVVSCKDKNDLPLGEKYRRVYDYGGGDWSVDDKGVMKAEDFFMQFVSISCNHCSSPACLASCPVGAIIKRDDGIVYIDTANCIGCNACIGACPYGAPYMSTATGLAHKCDFCKDLIDKGENPVCVQSCPMRCLEYGEIEALRADHGNLAYVKPVTDVTRTEPNVVFSPTRWNPDDNMIGDILNPDVEITSETITI